MRLNGESDGKVVGCFWVAGRGILGLGVGLGALNGTISRRTLSGSCALNLFGSWFGLSGCFECSEPNGGRLFTRIRTITKPMRKSTDPFDALLDGGLAVVGARPRGEAQNRSV